MDLEDFLVKPQQIYLDKYIKKIKNLDFQSNSANQIIIYGFPFDEGTQRNGGRIGSEQGPQNFRTGLEEIQGQLFQNIEKLLEIYDLGDIEKSLGYAEISLEDSHQKLSKIVQEMYSKHINCIPFIIGGSNDQSYPNARGLMESYPNSRIAAINIDAHFDVRPLKDGKAHSGSPFRLLIQHELFAKNDSILIEFASQSSQCSQDHYQFILENKGQVFWLDKHIRREILKKESIKTQAGQLLDKIFQDLNEKVDFIFFSFDVDSINSSFCPGVSAPSVVGGLSVEEAIEISYLAGLNPKVKLYDMSEFNPAVEARRSRKLLAEIFKAFCKGICNRK